MLLSWLYEFTPEGIVRTEDLHPAQARSIQRATGRVLDFIIIGVLLLAIAMLIVGRLPFYRQPGESFVQKSIAVLPFENRSEDKANAYFADDPRRNCDAPIQDRGLESHFAHFHAALSDQT